MAAARARLAHHHSKPVAVLPCRMVLSLARNGNGLLNVRCECMAGTVNRPSSRYYNYDTLGESLTIDQARNLFEVHLAAKGEDHGPEPAG
jgi:hypothetical protein